MKRNNVLKILIIFLLLISFVGTGFMGIYIKDIFLFLFGGLYYWVSALLIMLILASMMKKKYRKKIHKFILILLFACLSIDLLLTLIRSSNVLENEYLVNQVLINSNNVADQIGLVQAIIVYLLYALFGYAGVYIGAIILMILSVSLVLDIDEFIGKIYNKRNAKASPKKEEASKANSRSKTRKEKPEKTGSNKQKLKTTLNFDKFKNKKEEVNVNTPLQTTKEESKEKKNENDLFEMRIPIKGIKRNKEEEKTASEAVSGNSKYMLPSTKLLDEISNNEKKYDDLKKEALKRKKSLEQTLESFNVKAAVKNITVGSTITKYELQPEPGQKVSKFSSLSNDLAMALEASSVRIEAPIPGKSLVGIEVPNSEKLMVGLKEILEASKDNKNKLKVALGKDIEGKAKFLEIDKTPHLLIAGATGSGKSVCINSIITSILLHATPEEVKFLLVDPKKVELTPYEGIPHLLAPVITDAEKATIALNKLVLEMEHRYELFAETKTRNITGYNNLVGEEKLPYIVAIIDELADLMMIASSDIESSISRIAQKARAAGIHMILATQRPSTDVITGLIKSNIPSRISFMVSSSIDSRTILDSKGAEKLLGHGDMLLSRAGKSGFERIQGGYLSDEEISKVVSFITDQVKDENIDDYYKEDFVKLEKSQSNIEDPEDDILEREAIQVGIAAQRISTSLLQRKLKIGYNRAANIIDNLETKGYVTKQEGNKGRKVIIERVEADDQESK